eukprot:jgi/Hompol1/118/HPOL_005232-RA
MMQHFKDYVVARERGIPISHFMFQFLAAFWTLQHVFEDVINNPAATRNGPSKRMLPIPPVDHPVFASFKAREQSVSFAATPDSIEPASSNIVVPPWLAAQLLRFYATFLVPGGPGMSVADASCIDNRCSIGCLQL